MIQINNIYKIIGKIFLGILITICIILFSGFGLTFLVQQFTKEYIDPLPFLFEYPLITVSLSGIYFVFWKKQYAFTIGLALGFVVFMLIMTFLFEVLAGPASL